jgi:hypothetical protein
MSLRHACTVQSRQPDNTAKRHRQEQRRGSMSSSGMLQCVALVRTVLRLLVTANVVPSSLIIVTLMMEAIRSSVTSVLTRATWFTVAAVKTSNLT